MRLKNKILSVLKFVLPAALFVYLLYSVDSDEYRSFLTQPKRWGLLVTAQLVAILAITISFLRWFLLVRAFEIPFTIREALRLGFLGYLLNFVSFGSVGGDLFKAILVARDKPEKRPEAVASVLLDRAIGLLGLVILAWLSLSMAPPGSLSTVLVGIRNGAFGITIVAIVSLLIALYSGRWFDRFLYWVATLPFLGESLSRMARAVRQLRSRPYVLVYLITLAVCVHTLLGLTVFLISSGTYLAHPSLAEHFMVVPPGMAAGALPLAPGGIGVQETAISQLFEQLPNLPEDYAPILVATVYRFVTIAITGIGLIFYWLSHGREFKFVKSTAG